MRIARWMVPVIVGVVVTPISIGVGSVLLGTSDDSEAAGGDVPTPMSTELKAGDVGVPVMYAKLLRDAAADCDEKPLTAPVLAAQLKRESNFNPRARSVAVDTATGDEGSLTDPRSAQQRAEDGKTGEQPVEDTLSGGGTPTAPGSSEVPSGEAPPDVAQAARPVTRGIAQFSDADWAAEGVDGNNDGVKDVLDPADAIPSQGRKMCGLLRTAEQHPGYRGTPLELALAGYHMGWETVERYGGVPRASGADGETYEYVKAVVKSSSQMVVPVGGDVAGGWTLPVEGPAGTPYHQRGSAWSTGLHTGVDFVIPAGTQVKAVGPGEVVTAGAGGDYGNQVVIRHEDGTFSQYAHLSEVKAVVGQSVQGGTLIGWSGDTGNSSGPHLHFEVRTGPGFGSDVPPVPFLRTKGLIL
ncbi:murein DD-endopeptidase MepM/ murein hydrolase activator NlpD [Streptomyces clavifer]|uniref:Murein DD-endopeptidase MepM/ murein hydrolase activator NlpD n=2 Tax=Streptomyces TaxID=1883 RepID=A0ABS4VCM7_9ACTN|nr:peptidoglycan DD-metalloendopeptidase family protein [Streptomyces sp. Root1319]MBP2361668.1 murein DD-endopeptidase MepM/ murein hydrolase activator NlpD [Streptomyces clavifer]MDX2743956.1 peptidoglycan DD-metalloendopeptidase family protein [Streptomyces sp. NRRL_B-2557]MDX3065405.1 peptidoglycan DD-metalloendopeptidase family protein [Streptomyces sp. ND04-05B]